MNKAIQTSSLFRYDMTRGDPAVLDLMCRMGPVKIPKLHKVGGNTSRKTVSYVAGVDRRDQNPYYVRRTTPLALQEVKEVRAHRSMDSRVGN